MKKCVIYVTLATPSNTTSTQ